MSNKQATDAMVYETLNSVIKAASLKATLLSEYMLGRMAQQQKQAEGDMMQEAMTADAPPTGAGGGMPTGGDLPDGAAQGPAGSDEEVAQLLQALEQAGVTPEELEQALSQEGGEAEDAAPPAAPAAEKASAAKLAESDKLAMNNYVAEVLKRSRKR